MVHTISTFSAMPHSPRMPSSSLGRRETPREAAETGTGNVPWTATGLPLSKLGVAAQVVIVLKMPHEIWTLVTLFGLRRCLDALSLLLSTIGFTLMLR
ncbi:hypothetical protein HMN09_00372300 [Mycena chlorophos]|uniref:Uncharacterized protein n=1 Tax=Mycena chlorophos TaxID=658473 RepID=A0A8H6TKW8_MYCCL|nr:hypothetical protein HMN09_00372300 [Mycena chlorophos]